MKNNFYLPLVYFFGFLIFSFIYFFSFHLPIFSQDTVLFYRGLKLLFFTTLLFFLIIFFVKKKLLVNLSLEIIISILVFSFSLHLTLFVVFPVTFERSLTMFLLNKVNHNQGVEKGKLEKILVEEYLLKNKALEKRIKEQKEIDFLIIKNNRVYLTKKAKAFLNLSLLIKKIYGVK